MQEAFFPGGIIWETYLAGDIFCVSLFNDSAYVYVISI